ncbi:MAG: restriction endonuclease [Methanobacterium sp.]
MRALEKKRLVDFVAKIMEQSGFKIEKNYRVSKYVVDVYGVLPTVLGDIGVVVACKNYEERWKVGMDVLKEMEMTAKTLQASKIVVITTSEFSPNAISYAERRGIKLIDKDELMALAKSLSQKTEPNENPENEVEVEEDDYTPSRFVSTSFIGKGRRGSLSGRRASLSNSNISEKLKGWIKAFLSNTIGLIIVVLAVSTLITYLITPNNALLGILRIAIAAVLSYGIVAALERDLMVTLIKGSTVFFVTLIIYIALIILT